MSSDQQVARVNVSDDEWIEFRTLEMRERRSIADYLGELVRRELGGSKEPAKQSPSEKPERPRRQPASCVRLANRDVLTELPRRTPAPPLWET